VSTSLVRVVAIFAGFALIAGCGSSGQVKVYPVKGLVTLEGKPMKGGGSISFVPISDQKGKTAGGTINEDGTYTVSTYKEGDGSMAGDFRVEIMQVTVKEPEASPDGSAPKSAPSFSVPVSDRIAPIYSDRESPLTAKVEPKANELNFDLKRE
jgi:hypothetical protein